MAKRNSSGEVKSLEDRLGNFAFMRRAREKSRKEEEVKKRAFDDTQEWAGGSMSVSGCTVVMEGGGGNTCPTGRMSFQSFNPRTEKIQKDLESESVVLQRIRDCGTEYRREMASGAEISDLEMAKRLGAVGADMSVLGKPTEKSAPERKQNDHGNEENKQAGGEMEENQDRPAKQRKRGDGGGQGGVFPGSSSRGKLASGKSRKKRSQQNLKKRKHQKEWK
ncbi:hypothetical protein BSKO_03458 [Bryopsis sp. KO-2023]|nr:hypothetical protein BSKO_03458 [Bryopsis sp. KO-2023]